MVAALSSIGTPIVEWGKGQAEEFFEDPIAYFIRVAQKLGVILLGVGFILGIFGYYLKAAATTAANNEMSILNNIGTIFSNIKAPTFQPAAMGTAPLSFSLGGVNNFFSDAWTDIQGLGGDIAQIGGVIGTLAEDVGIGIADVAKAILAFVMHTPDLLWNGLIWAVGGGIADIINFAFPYLIIAGGFLIIASLIARGFRWMYQSLIRAPFQKAESKWQSRLEARSERFWDRVFGNFRHPIAETVAPEPLEPVAPIVRQTSEETGIGKALPAAPEGPERIPTPPEAPNLKEVSEGLAQAGPEPVSPAEAVPPAPMTSPNVVGPTPTVDIEEQLGGHKALEPTAEELRAQEAARKESLPEPEEEISDVDRQREILMQPLEA